MTKFDAGYKKKAERKFEKRKIHKSLKMPKKKMPNQPVKKQVTLLQFHGFERSANLVGQASKSDQNPEPKNENVCNFCLKPFKHKGAMKSHQMFCKENPRRIATEEHFDSTSTNDGPNPDKTEDFESNLIAPIMKEILDEVCNSSSTPGGWKMADIFKKPSRILNKNDKVFDLR